MFYVCKNILLPSCPDKYKHFFFVFEAVACSWDKRGFRYEVCMHCTLKSVKIFEMTLVTLGTFKNNNDSPSKLVIYIPVKLWCRPRRFSFVWVPRCPLPGPFTDSSLSNCQLAARSNTREIDIWWWWRKYTLYSYYHHTKWLRLETYYLSPTYLGFTDSEINSYLTLIVM